MAFQVKKPRERKTKDVWVMQSNYGYGQGWEDETAEESYLEIKQRLKEYRDNAPEGRYRIRLKREKIIK